MILITIIITFLLHDFVMDITSAALFGIIAFLTIGNMRILPVAFDVVILSIVLAGVKKAGDFGTYFPIPAL